MFDAMSSLPMILTTMIDQGKMQPSAQISWWAKTALEKPQNYPYRRFDTCPFPRDVSFYTNDTSKLMASEPKLVPECRP